MYTATDQLIAENIYVRRGGKAIINGATIRADQGMVTGLLGRNGSGKSTMLQAIYGAIPAQECDIFWNGRKIKAPFSVPRLLHYLPQDHFLPRNIKMRQVLRHFDIDEAHVLKHFPELSASMDFKTDACSGGEERLWSAVIIILAKGRFALLDELFTGVMPLYVERLKSLIAVEKANKGFIITDHRYQDVLQLADRIYFMKEGRSFLLQGPEDLIRQGYLSHLPE